MGASPLSRVSAVNSLQRETESVQPQRAVTAWGHRRGPSSALCPLQVSNIQRESRATRPTDGKHVIKEEEEKLE